MQNITQYINQYYYIFYLFQYQYKDYIDSQTHIRIMKLSEDEKLKYAKIIFNSQGRIKREIARLSEQQLEILRNIYAQKIPYECINGKIEYYRYENPPNPVKVAEIPSLWESLFCICYPTNYQQDFDITTSVFLERSFYPLFFWNDSFFDIHEDNLEYYGFVWLSFTYALILAVSSTLSSYFVRPTNFEVDYWIYVQSFAFVYIYKGIQIIILNSAMACLGGYIYSIQTVMAVGYSLLIYCIPTILCVAPSLYWHVVMMSVGVVLRTIFLGMNLKKKLESRHVFIFLAVFVNQLVYMFLVMKIMFGADSGYTFDQGFVSIFGNRPKLQQSSQDQSHKLSFYHLRHQSGTYFNDKFSFKNSRNYTL